MAPKLRVLQSLNARHDKHLENEITSSLASVMRTNPNMDLKDAMFTVTNQLLTNNPFEPPKNGKCPINDLPDELLGHIFSVGVDQQREDELDGYESEDAGAIEEEEEEDDEEEDEEEDGEGDKSSMTSASSDTDMHSIGDSNSDMYDDEVQVPFQVLVSHVCKRWRAVALDSHVLWTTLDFAKRPYLDKARTYISRAQGLPLSICIDCTLPDGVDEVYPPDHPLYSENQKEQLRYSEHSTDPDSGYDTLMDDELRFLSQQDLSSILDLLEPEVAHWGAFEFRASTYAYVQLLLSRLHKLPPAPVLQSFQMYHFEDCDDYESFNGDDKTSYLPFQGVAPMLKDAVFWGVHIDWAAAVPSFLSGLHELELSFHAKDVRPSYDTFEQIMKRSPDLHTLHLSLSGPALPNGVAFDADREDGGWGPTPLTISSLRELALQFHGVKYACALVQHLDLPNATGLLLNYDEEDYSEFVRTLLRPVQGRTESVLAHIDHMKISGLPCDIATQDMFLDQLTQLESLNLKISSMEDDILFEKLIDPTNTKPSAELYPDDFQILVGVGNGSASAGASGSGNGHAVTSGSGSSSSAAAFTLPKVFCPKLTTLTTNQVDGTRLKGLVAARAECGCPLKRVFMSNNDRVSSKEEKWLRAHLDTLEFFEPSDSEDEVEVYDDDGDSDEWETDEEGDGPDGDDDEDNDDDDEISPVARYLGRSARRRGRMDVD